MTKLHRIQYAIIIVVTAVGNNFYSVCGFVQVRVNYYATNSDGQFLEEYIGHS